MDRPRQPTDLRCEDAFLLGCYHALRDGVLEAREERALLFLARALQLDSAATRAILESVQEVVRRERPDRSAPLDGPALFEELCELVCLDGRLEREEEWLLLAARHALRLPEETTRRIFDAVRRRHAPRAVYPGDDTGAPPLGKPPEAGAALGAIPAPAPSLASRLRRFREDPEGYLRALVVAP